MEPNEPKEPMEPKLPKEQQLNQNEEASNSRSLYVAAKEDFFATSSSSSAIVFTPPHLISQTGDQPPFLATGALWCLFSTKGDEPLRLPTPHGGSLPFTPSEGTSTAIASKGKEPVEEVSQRRGTHAYTSVKESLSRVNDLYRGFIGFRTTGEGSKGTQPATNPWTQKTLPVSTNTVGSSTETKGANRRVKAGTRRDICKTRQQHF